MHCGTAVPNCSKMSSKLRLTLERAQPKPIFLCVISLRLIQSKISISPNAFELDFHLYLLVLSHDAFDTGRPQKVR